jgi:DNA-binding NarL/FixJ family response regulator
MGTTSKEQLSILLVCPPGLSQVSLVTTINAFPWATVVAKAKDVDTALAMVRECSPDVLLSDAYYLGDSIGRLLRHMHAFNPQMLLVVLASTFAQRKRFLGEGAHIVLDYNNVTRQLPQILTHAKVNFNDRE